MLSSLATTHHRAHRQCMDISHRRTAQPTRMSVHTDPIRWLAPLPLRVGDIDISTQRNHVFESKFLRQVLKHRNIAKPAVGHHRHLHPRRHCLAQRAQQLIFISPMAAIQRRCRHRSPHQRRRSSMTGQHRQHNCLVTVACEARPIQRHHNLHARTDHVRPPIAGGRLYIDGLIAKRSVELLDSVLGQPANRMGETLTNRMSHQRNAGEHPQRRIGQRQHPLRVQVTLLQVGDEFADVVPSQYRLVSHRLPPRWIEGCIVIPMRRIDNLIRLRPRNNGSDRLQPRARRRSSNRSRHSAVNYTNFLEHNMRYL